MDYVKKHFPQTRFRRFDSVGHGGLAPLQPECLVRNLERIMVRGIIPSCIFCGYIGIIYLPGLKTFDKTDATRRHLC